MSLSPRAKTLWPTERGSCQPRRKCTPSRKRSVVTRRSFFRVSAMTAQSSPIPRRRPERLLSPLACRADCRRRSSTNCVSVIRKVQRSIAYTFTKACAVVATACFLCRGHVPVFVPEKPTAQTTCRGYHRFGSLAPFPGKNLVRALAGGSFQEAQRVVIQLPPQKDGLLVLLDRYTRQQRFGICVGGL